MTQNNWTILNPLNTLFGKWKKELQDGAKAIFSNKRDREGFESRREAFERKIGQLIVEIDYLKKKLEKHINVQS